MIGILVASIALAVTGATAAGSDYDGYVRPYVASNNFSGVILVRHGQNVLIERAYGYADRGRLIANTTATRFHVASISMQLTAAVIVTLAKQGRLDLEKPVDDVVACVPGARGITIRDLLEERSGLPDVNALNSYSDLLQAHQTPQSLVDAVCGRPMTRTPGTPYRQEEHSAYNVLALLTEREMHVPFATAEDELVFTPLGLRGTSIDDDAELQGSIALGYATQGVDGVIAAPPIHWSAKTGNGSLVTTAADLARWVENAKTSLPSVDVGYGWFRSDNARFAQVAYRMTGRAPGYSSFLLYLPKDDVTVVVLSNIYSSVTSTIGYDLAAIALGLPHEAFTPLGNVARSDLNAAAGAFAFGADFYQPNAKLSVGVADDHLAITWPGGSTTDLIAVGKDRYVDRAYWASVRMQRDSDGRIERMIYDGFEGTRTSR